MISSYPLRSGILAAILLLITSGIVFSQDIDRRTISQESRGKDFWVCFPQNARYERFSGLQFRLYVTADKATTGTLSIPGFGIVKKFSLGASEILPLDIDSNVQVLGSDQIQKVGVHLESDNPVAVYGLSRRPASTDSYLALPTNVLGTVYRAV